jgi:hypothetical protein
MVDVVIADDGRQARSWTTARPQTRVERHSFSKRVVSMK